MENQQYKLPKASDRFPVNAQMFAEEAAAGARRFEYLIARRDQILDRLRFGVLTLNGASLVALMGALGGDGHAAAWIGFNPPRARMSAVAFTLGVIAAGASAIVDSNLFRLEAGNAVARYSSAVRLSALHNGPDTPAISEQIGEVMKEHHKLPLVDFQYSITAITLQNAAIAAWLFGIGVPLMSVIH